MSVLDQAELVRRDGVHPQQRFVALAAVFAVLLALGYALLPFRMARVVDCRPALLGADAKSTLAVGPFLRPNVDCHTKGASRLAVTAVVALLAVGVGALVMFVPAPGRDCREGQHDTCRGNWPALMGLGRMGEACSCHCTCHS